MIHKIQIFSFRLFLLCLILFMISIVRQSYAQPAKATSSVPNLINCGSLENDGQGLRKAQQIKTLTSLYWKTFEASAPKVSQELLKKGIVVGDFHTKNLGLYFDPNQNNLFLVLNDLDDAGENYLLGDLVKYLIFLKRTYKEINLKPVIEAYHKGLTDSYFPEALAILKIREKFRRNPVDALEKINKKILNVVNEIASIEVAPKKMSSEDKEIQAGFKNELGAQSFLIDKLWMQIENSGSSRDMRRYEFIVRAPEAKQLPEKNWIEFKELKCPGSFTGKSLDLKEHFKKVNSVLSKIDDIPADILPLQKSVNWVKGSFFLKRFKLPNLLNDVSEFDQNMADFYGYYLGKAHSPASTQTYSNAVWNKIEEIKDLAKNVRKNFFNEVED